MAYDNLGLVAHAKKALKEGWYYLWGAYGQKATQAVIDANIKQYPQNSQWKTYASGAIGTTRVCDCYGLVKSYLWWTDDAGNPKYNAKYDVNTLGAYTTAKEKGPLANIPEIPGLILYMAGHVGVYTGGGKFIECAGGGKGVVEGEIKNGAVIKGSRFTNWFKDVNIAYQAAPPDTPIQTLVKAGIIKSPEYWETAAPKVNYLPELLKAMADYVKAKP